MSLTEEIFARLGSEGTHSILTASAVLTAMLLLPCGPNSSASAIPQQRLCYNAIEASGSSFPVCRITTRDFTEKPSYRPKTALGERLMALRNQAIVKGLTLLDADEIIEEVLRRRGEVV
jgi:hypothetical protein